MITIDACRLTIGENPQKGRTMNNYKILITNDTGTDKGDLIGVIQLQRDYITKREFKLTVQELFYWAAQSCDYSRMTAIIYRNEKKILVIGCSTYQDGSEVKSTITANNEPIRIMTVAE